MDHYIDITIKPDSEMRENVLMNKVVTKFHKTLCDLNSHDLGLSFPEYRILLGRKLRVHSTKGRLKQLQNINWLDSLSDYCQQSEILKVPSQVTHRTVSRIQQNMTNSKLNRLIKRGSISESEVKTYKAKMYAQGLSEAYLELESTTNGHHHRRYVSFGKLISEPKKGLFDFFGFSKEATIPWF
jgi:CRISPR-associated endonuclease Csy4